VHVSPLFTPRFHRIPSVTRTGVALRVRLRSRVGCPAPPCDTVTHALARSHLSADDPAIAPARPAAAAHFPDDATARPAGNRWPPTLPSPAPLVVYTRPPAAMSSLPRSKPPSSAEVLEQVLEQVQCFATSHPAVPSQRVWDSLALISHSHQSPHPASSLLASLGE
jgi:hypothetical protein